MAPALSIMTLADFCHQYGDGGQSLGVKGLSEGPMEYISTFERETEKYYTS